MTFENFIIELPLAVSFTYTHCERECELASLLREREIAFLENFFEEKFHYFPISEDIEKSELFKKKAEIFDRQVKDRFSDTFFSHDTTFSHDIDTTFFETGQPVYYQQ